MNETKKKVLALVTDEKKHRSHASNIHKENEKIILLLMFLASFFFLLFLVLDIFKFSVMLVSAELHKIFRFGHLAMVKSGWEKVLTIANRKKLLNSPLT